MKDRCVQSPAGWIVAPGSPAPGATTTHQKVSAYCYYTPILNPENPERGTTVLALERSVTCRQSWWYSQGRAVC
eukprot:COSAG01_NODE_982_length_12348_cov_6.696394_3_plen_74_part_00